MNALLLFISAVRAVFFFFARSSVCEICYKSVCAGVKPHMPRLPHYERDFSRFVRFFFLCPQLLACVRVYLLHVCARRVPLLRARCVSPKFVCVRVRICNPRPFNGAAWIRPISRSPWQRAPLITEGPGRSNRCASLRCLCSTTVARNLCCALHTGACRRRWKPAGAPKHCLDVPV